MPPMLADRIAHILDAISDIQTLLSGRSAADLATDKIAHLAIERSFEIISEASRHIPDTIKARQPDIDWHGMAALGNRLRHAYHLVDMRLLWEIAERDLPPLKTFIERIVRNAD